MKGKKFSRLEKESFKRGMQVQYAKEHPLMRYVAYSSMQYYNADGSKYGSAGRGEVHAFRTKKEAVSFAKKINDSNSERNKKVLRSVKAKRVDERSSSSCSTIFGKWEKVKPFRK